jgi:hypothetical protein
MRPNRNFRFQNKKECFAVVGFRYDQPSSIEYDQYKEPESVAKTVARLLTMKDGADVISIRRVYLDQDSNEPVQDWKEKGQDTLPEKID